MSTLRRMILAVCVGCGLGAINLMIPQDGTALGAVTAFYFVVVPVSLTPICWPLTTYRTVFWVTGVGCLCENLVYMIEWYNVYVYGEWIYFPMMWVYNALVAGGVVLIRRRFFPVFPEGCCQHCGYDLRGSKDRCPECGCEFETT